MVHFRKKKQKHPPNMAWQFSPCYYILCISSDSTLEEELYILAVEQIHTYKKLLDICKLWKAQKLFIRSREKILRPLKLCCSS